MKPQPIFNIAETPSSLLWNRSWGIAAMILIGFATYLFFYDRGPVSLKMDFVTFPTFIGEWEGKVVDLQEAPFRIHESDHELLKIYRRGNRMIHLYVGYLTFQRQGREIANGLTAKLHRDSKKIQLQIGPDRSIFVNLVRLGGPKNKRQTLFWYYVNDHVIADQFWTKLATIQDALLKGRTNGAFVLLSSDSDDTDIEPEKAFIRELLPILRMYLP